MCAFVPRTTAPERNNKWWTSKQRGGASPCLHDEKLVYCAWPGSTLQNCTGYSWGRFSEILGAPMQSSPPPNAGTWYSSYASQYNRGQQPQAGAVGCFERPREAGHVLIVEAVYPDGSILTSESGYSTFLFNSIRRYPPNYMSSPYRFQGFIYNPAVTGQVGRQTSTTSPGTTVEPFEIEHDPRDLSQFTDFTGFDLQKRLGPVVYAQLLSTGLIKIVKIGNFEQQLLKTDQINKYIYSNMYTSYNTRNDAIGREADYWSVSSSKPSISQTEYKISAMNYTPLLEDIWSNVREKFTYYQLVDSSESAISDKFGIGKTSNGGETTTPPILDSGYSPTDISNDLSVLESNPRNVIQFFVDKGLTVAAGVGIAANIKQESNFRTSAKGDSGTSFGICQWHKGRGTQMKEYCNRYGGNWDQNLTGQLEYLWFELLTVPSYGLAQLRTVYNSLEGAKQAADIFVRKFERPADVYNSSLKRQANAETYWNTIVRYL